MSVRRTGAGGGRIRRGTRGRAFIATLAAAGVVLAVAVALTALAPTAAPPATGADVGGALAWPAMTASHADLGYQPVLQPSATTVGRIRDGRLVTHAGPLVGYISPETRLRTGPERSFATDGNNLWIVSDTTRTSDDWTVYEVTYGA
jgi:hypothetical protein